MIYYAGTEIGWSQARWILARSRTENPTASLCSGGASYSSASPCWSVFLSSSSSSWWTGAGARPNIVILVSSSSHVYTHCTVRYSTGRLYLSFQWKFVFLYNSFNTPARWEYCWDEGAGEVCVMFYITKYQIKLINQKLHQNFITVIGSHSLKLKTRRRSDGYIANNYG